MALISFLIWFYFSAFRTRKAVLKDSLFHWFLSWLRSQKSLIHIFRPINIYFLVHFSSSFWPSLLILDYMTKKSNNKLETIILSDDSHIEKNWNFLWKKAFKIVSIAEKLGNGNQILNILLLNEQRNQLSCGFVVYQLTN